MLGNGRVMRTFKILGGVWAHFALTPRAIETETETQLQPQPLFEKMDEKNADEIYARGDKDMAWFSFAPHLAEHHAKVHKDTIEDIAKIHKDKTFLWYDTKKYEEHAAEELGCIDFPCLSLVTLDEDGRESFFTRTLPAITPEHINDFFRDQQAGYVMQFDRPYFIDLAHHGEIKPPPKEGDDEGAKKGDGAGEDDEEEEEDEGEEEDEEEDEGSPEEEGEEEKAPIDDGGVLVEDMDEV